LTDRRPNPEELLLRVLAEERSARRGRLKIFLGYASRVGKSFRMLDEGRRRKERGEDVMVGAVQGKIGPEVQALLDGFEVIPIRREARGGRAFESIDVFRILERNPGVCLIDELASDNPPGSRHTKRWQDVDELLEHGIAVITAINLQHIEEEQDAVERITGKRAPETVPGQFIRDADEIVVVDAAPEDLAFRPGAEIPPDIRRVTRLRERALVLAADVVEKQLQNYLEAQHLPQTWGTHERILVCLTPRSNAEEMISAGRRNADRFHGALLACSVEQPGLGELDCERLRANLELARQAGAEVHCLKSRDFVRTILQLARQQRITQIYLGHSQRRRRWKFSRTPLDHLIDEAEQFDVRLFPNRRPA
jgi:two-component system, OmpR family, sensor histidine kinase KdpD